MSPAIHISDVRAFRSCRRKWSWSSRLKEDMEPIAPYPPFFTGKAIHAALEFYHQDKISFDETLREYFKREQENLAKLGALWPTEVAQVEEQIGLIEGIVDHYVAWQQQDTMMYSDKNLEFILMEEPFSVELMPGVMFEGRMDGLVKHIPTGKYWIWETKTTRSIKELTDTLSNDEQSGAYLWAAREWFKDKLETPVAGVLYNIIRKKVPAVPRVLQSGGLSKATSMDTTSFWYKYCVQSIFSDWSDETIEEEYGDIIEALHEKNLTFFMRLPIFRSDYELDMLMDNIRATAKEMLNPDIALYPSPAWNTCTFCQFKSPCLTMNAGGNYRVLLEADYQKREGHESMRKDNDDE